MDSMTSGLERLAVETNQEDFSIEIIDGLMPNELKYIHPSKQAEYATYRLMELKKVDYGLYKGILKSREEAFLEQYLGYELEVRSFKDIDFDVADESHTIRLFRPAELINLTYVSSGRLPKGPHEIAVNDVYARHNNLSIGDSMVIGNEHYVVTGFVMFSDMNLPMLGTEFILDSSKITIGTVDARTYEKLKGEEKFYIAGKAQDESVMDTFKDAVIDDVKEHEALDFITQVVPTENQLRSGMIYEELRMGKAATLGICIFIASIAVMIVGILISKILKNEKVQIGVLKALGYLPSEIAVAYILLLLFIGVPMLLLGHYCGMVAAQPMKAFYLEFYLLPNEPITTQPIVFVTAVFVPLIFILGVSFYMIRSMLSKDTIDLLKVGGEEKMPRFAKWVGNSLKGVKAQTKFKYTFIFKNTSKFILFFWGIMFSGMLILMSFMMVDFFDKMTIEQYQNTNYVYDGYLDPSKPKPKVKSGEEKFLTIGNAFYEGEVISLRGLEVPNELYKLHNKKGEEITHKLSEGVVVNQSFSIAYGAKVGDELMIEIGDEVYTKEVVAISRDYGDNVVYLEITELSLNATENKSKRLFNGVYSTQALDEDMYLSVSNKYDIMNQAEMMQGFIKVAVYSMVGSAIFISALILYVLTTMTVEDNYYNISLLKVMGYNKKEVNNMILNSYLIYAIFTYLVSVPLTYLCTQVMVQYFSAAFGLVMPLEMQLWHIPVGLVIVIAIFEIGTFSAKRHIQKVSLQEVLKAYRE